MTTNANASRRTSHIRTRLMAGSLGPVTVVSFVLLIIWYSACLPMNSGLPNLENVTGLADRYLAAWNLERPVLPAPHQIIEDIYRTTIATPLLRETADGTVLNARNLLYHAWITLTATLVGFAIGVSLGIALAIAIVNIASLRLSLMPWIVASQTIPILAIAPIIIVALGSIGITGLLPKSIISAYLSFFPVTIGMVKGFNSPDLLQLNLMQTYSASRTVTFTKLRWPAATQMLFASLKVSISISLVGAIVGELPTGAQAGIGSRLLSGSYYGQTVQIWSALVLAAALAAILVAIIGAAERATQRAMGVKPEGYAP
ncbi:MAG: ABC transporter permease subunit [Hyphomicrobium sp.]